jgi:hypothetical protein
MLMMMFVLDNPDLLDKVLDAWTEKAGINGVTILESSGLNRHKQRRIPMRYVFGGESSNEQGNITLLAIVEDEDRVKTCLNVTESITGDLNQPNTGVFAAWTLDLVKGVPAKTICEQEE